MTDFAKAIGAYKAAYHHHCQKALSGQIQTPQPDDISHGATRDGLEAALPFLVPNAEGYPVAEWQRYVEPLGWTRVAGEDIEHYRQKGAQLRALYASVPADATPAMVAAALAVDWDNENEEATVHNVWHAMVSALSALSSSPVAPDELPFRRKDIDRGLILFRTSNNAHGYTNVSILSEKVDGLPQAAKTELANMMRNIAAELGDAASSQPEAEAARLRGLIRWAHDSLHEINPSNYDHDEVCKLNDASVEVILGLAVELGEKHGKSDAWWAERAAGGDAPKPEAAGRQMATTIEYLLSDQIGHSEAVRRLASLRRRRADASAAEETKL